MVRKRKIHDANFNYLEEVYFPTLRQRWFLLHTDPIWYRFILAGVVLESLIIIYMAPFRISTFSTFHKLFMRIQVIFNFIYLLDIILFAIQKFVFSLQHPYPNPVRRQGIIMIMELISVIPYELFIRPGEVFGSNEHYKYIAIYTLHTLKILRFFTHVYNNRRDMHNVFATRLLEMGITLLLFSGAIVHILTLVQFLVTWEEIFIYFQMISCNVAGRGAVLNDARDRELSVYAMELFVSMAAIIMWCIGIFPSTCFMILSFIESNQHRYDYAKLIQLFQKKVAKKYSLNANKYKLMMDYFEANWTLRAGFSQQEFGDFTQPSLMLEIAMDNCWQAFKHSFLFRQSHFYILRALVNKFNRQLRMEGEPIYTRNQKKPGLFYIVQGVIEVVSSENSESGVISLTSGTCIGEAALIFPHASSIDFKCKTICVLYELKYQDFQDFQRLYPLEHKQFRLKFLEVLMKVRRIKKYNAELKVRDIERSRLVWLKYNLHSKMAMRASYKVSHELTNIYLREELKTCVNEQKHVFHTYQYLDRLAIRQRSNTDNDIVFIRNTCPWILKANSPLTNTWERMILVVSILGAVVVSYGYCIQYTDTVKLLSAIIHVVFLLDLVIQIITPVSVNSNSKTISEILSERLRTNGFFLDILAVSYWKMIAFVIDTNYPWYELLKLLKLWRVWKAYSDWSNKFLLNLVFFCIMLGISAYATLIYTLSCIFALSGITQTFISPLTIQFATGAGLPFHDINQTYDFSYTFVVANGLSLLSELFTTTIICSVFYLYSTSNVRVHSLINQLSKYCKFEENPWLHVRLHAYFNILIHDESLVGSNIAQLFRLPKYFEIIMKSNVHLSVLRKLALFKGLSDDLVTKLLLKTELFTCYRHSIIISKGIIYKDVFVLVSGECRTLVNGRYYKTRYLEPLNLLENGYNLPSTMSTVALSEITILKFSYDTFLHLLYEDRLQYQSYIKTLEVCRDVSVHILMKLLYDPKVVVRAKYTIPAFKNFSYIHEKDSFEEFDYHVPFDKIKPFDFIKYFLMRNTIYPEGPFMRRYEFVRCTVAFASAIAFTIPALNIGAYPKRNGAFPLMLALDLFSLVDIYIRCHVGYYNKVGVLVMHPLATAKYYASHGLFIDLLAVFPFDIFPMKVQYRVVLNAVHALQLHRLHALRSYYSYHAHYYITNTISMVCYILFAANLIAGMIYVYDCYTWDVEDQFPEANCQTFKFEKTHTHFHILFLVMSALECSGMQGKIDVVDLDGMLSSVICVICVVGVLTTIIHKSYIFSCYITRIIDKYEFVVGVRKIIGLISRRRGRKFLCKEIAVYYDLHWSEIQSQNVGVLTLNMISAMRRDILFRFYGDHLVTNSIFNENIQDTTTFIKNIFLVAKPLVIPKNGYAITINDIEQYIYFLNHGSVDVLAPDGTKFTELTTGAMFGNLSSSQFERAKVSIVANVNTKLLYVRTTDFHRTMKYFSRISIAFNKHLKKNKYYIESTKPVEKRLTMSLEEYMKAVKMYSTYKVIEYIHLFYVCYIGMCFELYQLAIGEMHLFYLLVQYSMDLMHIIREFLRFRMPYKDHHRAPIFHMKDVFANQMVNRTEFFIMIVTVIYLDIFLVLPIIFQGHYNTTTVSYVFSFCRLNRLLRVYYISVAYSRQQVRVSECSSVAVKWAYNMYWFLVSYMTIAAVTAVLDSYTAGETSNVINNISGEMVRNMRLLPPREKFELYTRYLFFSNLIHIDTYDKYYGPTTILFIVYITMLYMYSMIISSFHLSRFFEAMVDIAVLRSVFLRWSNYLKFYIKKGEGTFTVKERVIENSNHTWTKTYYKSDFIMKKVCARYLREAVMADLYGYLIVHHPILGHTHLDFIRQLGLHYKNVMYPCNFVIAYKNENRRCMFFVHRGTVAVYDVDFGYQDTVMKTLTTGDSFGFLQGLGPFQALHEYTYITTSHCEILELEWDSWNYLLNYFPATNEYIMENAPKYEGHYYIHHLSKEVYKGYV